MDLSTREGKRQQGDRIKQAARETGLTLEEIAKRIDCSRALIYQYSSGISLAQSDRLQQIAGVVGKPLYWFFLEEGVSTPPAPEASTLPVEPASVAAPSTAEKREVAAAPAEAPSVPAEIAALQALRVASAGPPDWRQVADTCRQLIPLLQREGDLLEVAEMGLEQGNALIHLSEWVAAKEQLEKAEVLFRQRGKTSRAMNCLQSLGHVAVSLGRLEEGRRLFQQVAASQEWWNRWQGALSLGAVEELLGDYTAAMVALGEALRIVEERTDPAETEIALLYIEANWTNLELDCGQYQEALLRAERCIGMAQRSGRQDQYIEALLSQAVALLQTGELPAAIRVARQARDLAELSRDHPRRSMALSYLSLGESLCRRPVAAVAFGKEALMIALRCGAQRAEMQAQWALTEAYLVANNAPEADFHLRQGRSLAQSSRIRLMQAQFGLLGARVAAAWNRPEEARDEAQRALALSEELETPAVQMECLLTLAHIALLSEAPEAADHAERALALAATIQARHRRWIGEALSAQALLGSGQEASAPSAFDRAIADLNSLRAEWQGAFGEDNAMEDPAALELYQAYLARLVALGQNAEAREQALACEWPPLMDWLESILPTQGG